MAVSVIGFGLSAVNASGNLPANPEDRTITQELEHAIGRGDSMRVQKLSSLLALLANAQKEFNSIGDEWELLKAELEADGVAGEVDQDMKKFGLPNFGKMDSFVAGIKGIIPKELAVPGGAIPPSTEDMNRLAQKVDHLNFALDGFCNRVDRAFESYGDSSSVLRSPESALRKGSENREMTIGQRVQARLAAQGSPTERVEKICKAFGVLALRDMFITEFDENTTRHRYNWGAMSDTELSALVRNYLDNGYITIKKPLVFPNDTVYEVSDVTPFVRVTKACRNPDVPDYLILKFVDQFDAYLKSNELTWSSVNDQQIADYLNRFLRTGGI
ncbi:MAG: hypothetical protein Q8R43_02510 [Alphaproteobacteria bacterium]|nr:hypothetical protein [Alphaproteobacteria bacterium]